MTKLSLVVPDELAGQRLDIVIPRLAPQISRRHTRRLVDEGAVFVEGKRIQVCSRPVRAGARIEVALEGAASVPAVAVEIIHIDRDLVVANKPAGMPTEPTREGGHGTLVSALFDAVKARGESAQFLHAVHRLDTDTTGVVVFARSPEAAHAVGKQLHDGAVERRYLALVDGNPAWTHARLDQALAKSRDERGRVHVDPDGAPAITLATVLAPGTTGALVLCAPETGRTHQLRVHLAHAGHPLVGDRRYGTGKAPHLGLHALSLAITHPNGQPLRVSAAPPPAFFDAAAERGIPAAVIEEVVRHLASQPIGTPAGPALAPSPAPTATEPA